MNENPLSNIDAPPPCWTHGDSTCSVLHYDSMVAWFIRSGSWVLEALSWRELSFLPHCAYQHCFLMLTLFILYSPFFPHMRLLWTLAWKWSIFLMVVAHLQLWAHSPSLLSLHVSSLTTSMGFPCPLASCWVVAQTEGLEWGLVHCSSSLPARSRWLCCFLYRGLQVLSGSPLPCSPEFLACADSPSGTSSLAFQGTR